MSALECPACGRRQDVRVDVDTYHVACEGCGEQFPVPRANRKNKNELRDYKSAVNVRFGWSPDRPGVINVGWAVQSANKGNSTMELDYRPVDVDGHPEKNYWPVALFTALGEIEERQSAWVWIKDDHLLRSIESGVERGSDDPREVLISASVDRASEKFDSCEFGSTGDFGSDIREMVKCG